MIASTFDRIVVADDHPMFRDVLAESLRRTYPKADVATAQTLSEAINAAKDGFGISLFVLDLLFPGMEGELSVRQLRKDFPATSIIIVTMLEDPDIAAKMVDAGADGFLGKGLSADEMIKSIDRVREGEFVVNISSKSFGTPLMPLDEPLVLTPRQTEILRLVVQKMPNKMMGRELGISHHTVRNHVTILLRLLGVETRRQIAKRALELGLIDQAETDRRQR
jgi:two-component system, NarL family, nitrate/nitrite response regulator NarL